MKNVFGYWITRHTELFRVRPHADGSADVQDDGVLWRTCPASYARAELVVVTPRAIAFETDCNYQPNAVALGDFPTSPVLYDACGECSHCREHGIATAMLVRLDRMVVGSSERPATAIERDAHAWALAEGGR